MNVWLKNGSRQVCREVPHFDRRSVCMSAIERELLCLRLFFMLERERVLLLRKLQGIRVRDRLRPVDVTNGREKNAMRRALKAFGDPAPVHLPRSA